MKVSSKLNGIDRKSAGLCELSFAVTDSVISHSHNGG